MERDTSSHVVGQLLDVTRVLMWDEHVPNQVAMCGDRFFFQSANWQDAATQRDLACHRDIAAHGDARERADDRGRDRNSCRRAVFRRTARRDVHVQVAVAMKLAVDAQCTRSRTSKAECRTRRFLHHIADLYGAL